MLAVLPDHEWDVGGFSTVEGIVRIHPGKHGAGDIGQQVGAVVPDTINLETRVEVEGRDALVVEGGMVVDRVVDRLCRRAVLVDVDPELDAFDGLRTCEVGREVVVEEAATAP